MKKILVLGSRGMLGSMVYKVLSQDSAFAVIGTQSEDKNAPFYFTIEQGSAGLAILGECDYFINCIGVLSPVTDVERATAVNAKFPHALAAYAEKISARVIHMSTNGVFASRTTPYKESEKTTATDIYGKTKSDGEVVADNVLNIRTSIIGPSPIKKKGLLEWFRGQPNGATIQGYTNDHWNGVTTLQFAELCRRIIIGDPLSFERSREVPFEALRREGLAIHFVPNQTVTKYELLILLQKFLQKTITIVPTEDPRGEQSHLLTSTSKILPSLFPHDIPMERAINDLVPYF
ncbi:MAG: sugar nucleotide-binding protein [bacterium]|nr:sugar nucleotide-binding protein [bacterium]